MIKSWKIAWLPVCDCCRRALAMHERHVAALSPDDAEHIALAEGWLRLADGLICTDPKCREVLERGEK